MKREYIIVELQGGGGRNIIIIINNIIIPNVMHVQSKNRIIHVSFKDKDKKLSKVRIITQYSVQVHDCIMYIL